MYDGRGIANWILDHCSQQGIEITNLKIQKVIFFCHTWFLINHGIPLIKQNFEAWEYGPVLPYLYRHFSLYKNQPIRGRIESFDPKTNKLEVVTTTITPDQEALLRRLVDIYARHSSHELVEMSHAKNGPWWNTWNHVKSINPGMRLDNEEIRNFYASYKPSFIQ